MKHILSLALFVAVILLHSCTKDSPSGTKKEGGVKKTALINVKDCIVKTSPEKLEIVTWNIEHFPKNENTIKNVAALILEMNVDVLALQEIRNQQVLKALIKLLPGWKYVIHDNSDLNLAYLYKTADISINGNPYAILKENRYELPRSPYVLPIRFKKNNLDIILINNHFKAMKGTENESRRREASVLLKKWIDEKHANDNVILLGDLNDEITDSYKRNVFQIFLDDKENYRFADMKIAHDKKYWSYPSFPGHIDHILITDELFDNLRNVYTYTFNHCDKKYKSIVSDHYPVCIVLE